jgi:predicted methyltransferase
VGRAGRLVAALLLLSPPALSAQSSQQPPRTRRLFPPTALGLLEAPDRERWNKPDFIMDELKIFDGARVGAVAEGGGWFALRLSRRVGPNGRVYAEDIQPQMLEATRRLMQHEGRTNVTTVLGTPVDPKLPEKVDAVLIMGSYSELEDPVALLRNVELSLKPQGLLGIVDFAPGGGGPGPDPGERVSPDVVIAAAQAAGLRLVKHEPVPPFLFLLVFGKSPPARRPV